MRAIVCVGVGFGKDRPDVSAGQWKKQRARPSWRGGQTNNAARCLVETPSRRDGSEEKTKKDCSCARRRYTDNSMNVKYRFFFFFVPLPQRNVTGGFRVIKVVIAPSAADAVVAVVIHARLPHAYTCTRIQGADNIIMDRAASYLSSDKETVASHLGVFSSDGLRTLVLAKKEMTKASPQANKGANPLKGRAFFLYRV